MRFLEASLKSYFIQNTTDSPMTMTWLCCVSHHLWTSLVTSNQSVWQQREAHSTVTQCGSQVGEPFLQAVRSKSFHVCHLVPQDNWSLMSIKYIGCIVYVCFWYMARWNYHIYDRLEFKLSFHWSTPTYRSAALWAILVWALACGAFPVPFLSLCYNSFLTALYCAM